MNIMTGYCNHCYLQYNPIMPLWQNEKQQNINPGLCSMCQLVFSGNYPHIIFNKNNKRSEETLRNHISQNNINLYGKEVRTEILNRSPRGVEAHTDRVAKEKISKRPVNDLQNNRNVRLCTEKKSVEKVSTETSLFINFDK